MATRKLQTEIDKVLKKVAEGVETFEEIFEKIQTSTNANQKEKYESDLKKEIKKLQRQRDQIKTWISSNDIKDKRALMDNRKLIEQQMEKFKACEKEMKTKAYSREGLSMSGRLDPKEKEKAETCSWVTERVESLNIQIEALEAEVETLQAGAKKGKNNPAKERMTELEEKIERHKWHQGRLELILRLLENGQIDTEKIIAIQEDVNYYVDENLDPDFAEDEEIYTDLNLEEEEDYFNVGTEDHYTSHDHEHDKSKDKEDHDYTQKKQTKEEPEPPRTNAKPTPTKKLSVSEPKETKPAPTTPSPLFATKTTTTTTTAPPPSTTTTTTTHAPPTRQSTIPRAVESPAVQYAAAAAANLPAESPRVQNISSPSVAAATAQAIESPKSTSSPAKPEPQAPKETVKEVAKEVKETLKETVASPVPSPKTTPMPTSSAEPKAAPSTPVAPTTPEASPKTQSPPAQKLDAPSQPSEPEIRLPAALADLAHSFEVSKERAMSKDVGFFVNQMLEASFQFIPEQADTERPKYYTPKNPYPTPSYYPQTPPQGLFDNPAMFEKFDIDTLFFIFYYQQGTYQQYLAARELKKQSWRFHKKYLTWFQRHEEPKAITEDYEQGTYIYFDYEGAWCQRKKTEFRFEYKFLEDAELV
ncbi:general negative regulator of transcription subunit 5 [Podila verticillata]|nr:general negative regulator of transcription subunit 5 [Podila verticillata]